MRTGGPEAVTVCGRSFSKADLETIRTIIADDTAPPRIEIARRTCEALDWRTPAGRLKEMSCRVALLRLADRGLLVLPAPRSRNGNGNGYRWTEEIEVPEQNIDVEISELQGRRVRAVSTTKDSETWNEAIARFHYLGYKPLPGAQHRYLIEHDGGLLGAIGFGASAWKVAARDGWIGWTAEQRKRRLHLVLNNARFLLLPWVRVRHLASWALARCARVIQSDFEERFGYRPVLLETFVERDRFRGTCYHAANWVDVGETKGRGKLDRRHDTALPVKRVMLYPLEHNAREVLCA
jgi:hypothetical protein